MSNPTLIDAGRSALLVIDVQERLNPVMADGEGVIKGVSHLLEGAALMQVPVLVSEQYPKGLGPTVAPIDSLLPEGVKAEKTVFSCVADSGFADKFDAVSRGQAILCGIEAHICVLQTAMELLAKGVEVFVVVDATSSRFAINHQTAMERIARAGGHVVTVEMVLFEWLRRAGTPEFKQISNMVK